MVPHFSMAAAVLADTDLLLTVPSVTLKTTAPKYRLESRELPFDMPRMGLSLYRSATHGDEAGARWFLEPIEAVCRRLSIRPAERSVSSVTVTSTIAWTLLLLSRAIQLRQD
ncbi:MAG: hypothetical protein ACON3Z_15410 [Bradymonadia bacterium]